MTSTTTPAQGGETAADELDRLRAELADLPRLIDEATDAGNETELAGLLVRDRVLGRMIEQAEHRTREEGRAALLADKHQLQDEFDAAVSGIDDLELAADVFTRAAERRRQAAEPIRQRLHGIDSRLHRLDQDPHR